jgi:subtilisin-like proprotein convertase family protein
MNMRFFILASLTTSLGFSLCAPASAEGLTLSNSYAMSLAVPDNDSVGVSDTRSIVMPGATAITEIQVTLNIAGGFNGDFYAYLRHNTTGFAVLLNRVGVTDTDPSGYADSGMNVSFSDTAFNGDIHDYHTILDPAGGSLTGMWQPDGRGVDPALVLDSTPRDAMLNSFYGMDPNGLWTLFVSDNSALGLGTLQGWGLIITAVPEPTPFSLLGLGMGSLLAWRWWIKARAA